MKRKTGKLEDDLKPLYENLLDLVLKSNPPILAHRHSLRGISFLKINCLNLLRSKNRTL